MEMKPITLCGVPALAWGKDSDRKHSGSDGHDVPQGRESLRLLAEAAEKAASRR